MIGRVIINGPHHGPSGPVRLLDHGFVWHIPPLALDADAIVAVPCFPIDIRQRRAVCVGTTRPLARMQAVEPLLERRVGIAPV